MNFLSVTIAEYGILAFIDLWWYNKLYFYFKSAIIKKGQSLMKSKILWISAGGTFSCLKTEKGLSPASDKQFMNSILSDNADITDIADISPYPLMNIDSTEMSISDIKLIASEINKQINNFDGILITHGTDTMAYTAALLSVMLENIPVPVVITGSQKPYFSDDTDAKQNFKDAFSAVCEKSSNA